LGELALVQLALGTAANSGALSSLLTVYGAAGFPLIRLNDTSGVDYYLQRDATTGYLNFFGTQTGNVGYVFNNGNVGIGTTTPYAVLSISNSKSTAANTPLFVIASTTGGTATTTVLSVASTGDVTIIGSVATCVIGNGSNPTSCSASDQRLKDNVTGLDASSSLSAVRQLNPVSFLWNPFMVGNGASTSTQFGFIAQDVAKVFPNLVAQDAHTGYFKLDYQGLFAPIVGAVQVLAKKIDELAATVASFADHFTTWTNVCHRIGTPGTLAADRTALRYGTDSSRTSRPRPANSAVNR
jgi:Chaperone of endosialidase